MQLREILRIAAKKLKEEGFPTPFLDAEVLLSYILGVSRTFLYSHPEYVLTREEQKRYETLLMRRLLGEPVAYLVGEKEFRGRPFKVNRQVLIPRPETELLVDEALTLALHFSSGRKRIIDVGTGSGAIGVTIAAELERAWVLATDISCGALMVAQENAQRLGVRGKMDFLICKELTAISGQFHLILSNPPYIPSGEMEKLPAGVKNFEPLVALDGGKNGLDMHTKLIREAPSCLVPGGWLLLEIGGTEANMVKEIATDAGYTDIKIIRDFMGLERVIAMRKG